MSPLRALAGAAAGALLAGCMSVPLSTMWQLRSFSAEDLAAIDPAELRVASLVEPGPSRLDPTRSKLTLTLDTKAGAPEVHAFGLRLAQVQGGPIMPADDPRWQVLELDAGGLAAMRALKPRLANIREHYTGATLDVAMKLADGMPEGIDELRFSVRVQLADDQAPLVLFDRARVPVGQAGD